MVGTSWLSYIWKLASYVSDVTGKFEEFFSYLHDQPKDVYKVGILKKGDWISKPMERHMWNLEVISYTNHHGVVIDVENEGYPNEIVWVLHFRSNKIIKSTLNEFMLDEKILNVFEPSNPNVKELKDYSAFDGKYNIVTNNCEHVASLFILGVSESYQISVAETIAWQALYRKKESIEIDPKYKRPLKGRYYIQECKLKN